MRVGIIGAGPTGILATHLLIKNGIEVVLVEAGDFDAECMLKIDDYRFKSPSKIIPGVHKVGGGTNGWKGRISRFPRSAIESKSEAGRQNWPIAWETIDNAYHELARILKVDPIEDRSLRQEIHSCQECKTSFNLSPFQFINPGFFRELFRTFSSNSLVQIHLRTFCRRVVTSEQKIAVECEREVIGSLKSFNFDVDFVLIAAGCLQSTALVKRSFPVESKVYPVGSYLQEHFDGYVGRLHIRKSNKSCLRNYSLDVNRKLNDGEFGVGLQSAKQGRLHWHLEISPLARVYAFDPVSNRFDLSQPLLKLLFGIERIISAPLFRLGNLVNQVIGKETFSLWLKGEELPYEKSNLEIEPRDSKQIIYSHKVSKETSRQIWIEIDNFRKSIQEQNLGRIVFSPYIKLLRRISTGANWHPLGSMRMHASEAAVLNADLSFKFDRRVFCLDSSSFSTGAHHNPTAMSLTLTIFAVSQLLAQNPVQK